MGFERGIGCGVVFFYHRGRDISLAVHGDDFTFCAFDKDLKWIEGLMESWFPIKVRAKLGMDKGDDKSVTILGREVRWTGEGIEYEADPRHRKNILDYFGFEEGAKPLSHNGNKENKEEEWEEEELEREEAKGVGGLAATFNFLSQDCPDLQFPHERV